MHEQVCCFNEAASHQLPIAVALWIIQIVSMEECSSLMQNLMWICCSIRSVMLNVTATQYASSLNGIHHPHWLGQWSHPRSRMRIPVHSPWVSGYIDVMKTDVIRVIMAGLFLDRPCMCLEDYIMLELCMWHLHSWHIIELSPANNFYLYYYYDLKFFLSGKSFDSPLFTCTCFARKQTYCFVSPVTKTIIK